MKRAINFRDAGADPGGGGGGGGGYKGQSPPPPPPFLKIILRMRETHRQIEA